jgi:hypothetical protein
MDLLILAEQQTFSATGPERILIWEGNGDVSVKIGPLPPRRDARWQRRSDLFRPQRQIGG